MATLYPPLPHQKRCLRKLREARDRGDKQALVVMATGLGKTVTAAHFARRFVGKTARKVLFLCHNNDILTQSKKTFREVIGGKKGRFGDYTGLVKHREAQFLFASFQTMQNRRTEFAPDEFALVIVDEGHHGPAATYRPTIEYFRPQFLLGMTATPERTDLDDIREIYGEEVFNLPLETALAKGLLTKVRYELHTDQIVAKRLGGEKELETNQGRVFLKDLNKLFAIRKRDRKLVNVLSRRIQTVENPRVIIFCPSIAYCEWLSPLLKGAVTIHSGVKARDRDKRLAAFRKGDSWCALTVDAFNEGIDVPEANVIVFLRSTASKTVFFQQLGRGLRKLRGKERVLVLDFVGNCERLETVRRLARAVRRRQCQWNRLEEIDVGIELRFTRTVKRVADLVASVRTRLTPARLIEDLKRLAKDLGRTPTYLDMIEGSKRGRCASPGYYVKVFDSLHEAQLRAGLEPNMRRPQTWTKEEVTAAVRALGARLGRTPTSGDICTDAVENDGPPISVVTKLFGSVPAAQLAAGFAANTSPKKWTREALVDSLKRLCSKLGRTPSRPDMDAAVKDGFPSSGAYIREFGSIRAAQQASGLTVNQRGRRDWTKEGALQALRDLTAKLGRAPSSADVTAASSEGSCPSVGYLHECYGSLSAALAAIAVTARRAARRTWSNEEALQAVARLKAELGRRPSQDDVKAACKAGKCPGMSFLFQRFGGLRSALALVETAAPTAAG